MKTAIAAFTMFIAAGAFAYPATEQYADAAAYAAQTNAQNYADAKVAAAKTEINVDGKVAAATNGIPEQIHAVDVKADSAVGAAATASANAAAAVATANSASNVAATASTDLATERVTRQNADTDHTAAIAGETAARQAADALLAGQVADAVNAVSNKASAAALAAEVAARQAADAVHGAAINSKQATLVSGTNIKTINGQSVLGSGDLVIQGGGGTPDRGVWDEQMQIWWTPVMNNGKLTYQCTTNVNLNAGN